MFLILIKGKLKMKSFKVYKQKNLAIHEVFLFYKLIISFSSEYSPRPLTQISNIFELKKY